MSTVPENAPVVDDAAAPLAPPARVAVLGLGAMGGGLAKNVAAAGFETAVWNRTAPAPGRLAELGISVAAADSPAAAVRGAAAVLCCVADDAAARAVWLGDDGTKGALAATGRGAVAVECSTLSPACVAELAAAAAARGAAFVAAPLIGSRPQVAAGELVILAGGDAAAVDRVRPVLAASAKAVRHVGDARAASGLKLAVNMLLGVQTLATAEALELAAAAGVDRTEALDLLAGLPVAAPVAGRLGAAMLAGLAAGGGTGAGADGPAFAPNFPATLAEKDLRYAAALLGRETPAESLTAAAAAGFADAVAAGWGRDDLTGAVRRYRG